MTAKRESIDDMIDLHVWMRRQEARLNRRALTLSSLSHELLAEYGLNPSQRSAISYRCADPDAVLVPLLDITGPMRRGLNEDAVRSLLKAIRDGINLPPVVVFRETGAPTAALLDGLHRARVSLALGFISIPSIQVDREAAELRYGYGAGTSDGAAGSTG